MSDAPVAVPGSASPEDRARADFYALLARLFADAPDADLLHALATAPPLAAEIPPDELRASSFPAAWDTLRAASAKADPAAVGEEHQALFVGVGRSAVSPYGSYYIAPQSGRLLAQLRGTLTELGLSRRPEASTYEDHLASVFETMRILAVGDADMAPAAIGVQRAFFERYIASWVLDCCAAIIACPLANYYTQVAQFAQSFLALERDSFAMESQDQTSRLL